MTTPRGDVIVSLPAGPGWSADEEMSSPLLKSAAQGSM